MHSTHGDDSYFLPFYSCIECCGFQTCRRFLEALESEEWDGFMYLLIALKVISRFISMLKGVLNTCILVM